MVRFLLFGYTLIMSQMILSQDIKLTWDFYHPVKNTWLSLGDKGSVQEALIASGEMPDPFYGMNEGNGAAGLESYVRQALMMPRFLVTMLFVVMPTAPRCL